MRFFKTLVVLLLVSFAAGQTHTFPATDTTNTFTAVNTFQLGVIMGPYTVATLPVSGTTNAVVYATDGTAGSSPCTGGGGGAFAIWTGTIWRCNVAGGSASFNSLTGGTNSTAAMVVGTGASLTTSGSGTITATGVPFSGVTASTNTQALKTGGSGSDVPDLQSIGQQAANQLWMAAPLTAAVGTMANGGGSFIQGRATSIIYTFTTANGESLQSLRNLQSNSGFGGACVASCTLTITAPTLPGGGTTGLTSWTVYAQDCGSLNGCGGAEVKQAACTNLTIGVNCVLTAVGGGASFPTTNTAWVTPSVNVTGNAALWQGFNPIIWGQDSNGQWQPWAGMSTAFNNSTGPLAPGGQLSFVNRVQFNDLKVDPPSFKNTFVGVMHDFSNTAIEYIGNQNRALSVFGSNPVGFNGTTQYGLENIQAELDYTCVAPCSGPIGSPDGEVAVGSFQLSDQATAHWSSTGEQGVLRLTYFTVAGSGNSALMNNISATWSGASGHTYTNGDRANNYRGVCGTSTNPATGLSCTTLEAQLGGGTGIFGNGFKEVWMRQGLAGLVTPTTNDFFLQNDVRNLFSLMSANIGISGIRNTDQGTFPLDASVNITGSGTVTQISTAGLSTVGSCPGNPGASSYTYAYVIRDNNGGAVVGPTIDGVNMTGVCANPLTSGNPANLPSISLPAMGSSNVLTQGVSIDVYRTSGPMATGKIGTYNCAPASGGFPIQRNGCAQGNGFVDTGLAADGTAPPTVNTTGGIVANGLSQFKQNKFSVASNFTTANNTSLQTITGLVMNLSSVASTYNFHCALAYSQATANVAVAFGIQAATIAPTNIFSVGSQQITVGPPSTEVQATLATLNTTTATAIVTGTPGALATNYMAYLDGTIEEPQNNDAGNIINIMVSTANGADAVTVLRGSFCTLN